MRATTCPRFRPPSRSPRTASWSRRSPNIVRHARARQCRVSIASNPAGLAVTVTDDGAGLLVPGSHGHGLAIMRERAEELGGTVTVRDGPPGVSVEARLPTAE